MRRVIIGWALTVILTGLTLFGLWLWRLASLAPTSPVAATVAESVQHPDVPGTGNAANDRIAAMPSTEQALLLGRMVGPGCEGVMAFEMGIGRRDADKGDAYWSVRCADGKSYAVAFRPDKAGNAHVLPCQVMQAAGMDCFKKLPR